MMFCWHNWRVEEVAILPSLIEQIDTAGLTSMEGRGQNPGHKPYIVKYRCAKCSAEKVVRV